MKKITFFPLGVILIISSLLTFGFSSALPSTSSIRAHKVFFEITCLDGNLIKITASGTIPKTEPNSYKGQLYLEDIFFPVIAPNSKFSVTQKCGEFSITDNGLQVANIGEYPITAGSSKIVNGHNLNLNVNPGSSSLNPKEKIDGEILFTIRYPSSTKIRKVLRCGSDGKVFWGHQKASPVVIGTYEVKCTCNCK